MRQALDSRATGRRAGLVARFDSVLDVVVVGLATWTLVYHACLVLSIGSTVALAVEAVLVLMVVSALAHRRTIVGRHAVDAPSISPPGGPRTTSSARTMAGLTAVSTVVAAVAMALELPWPAVWVTWLIAAISGTWCAARTYADGPADEAAGASDASGNGGEGVGFAVCSAVVLAVFSTITLRPNPDDLFYVNLSQWVAGTGDFPVRDTLFSDLVYPMANWPPVASYDALTGAIAHLAGLRAGDVVYVLVPPVTTTLAVLALWRLLRAWRVPHVSVALGAALLFLLVDGTVSYGTPGNLFLTRLWQGKVILLCVLVPMLLIYLLRYVERPSRGRAGWLLLGGIAATGCSTTAIFLVPVIALGGAAPLILRRAFRPALTAFLAVAAYPLGAGLVTLALGGRSADDFGSRREYRFDPAWFGHEVFLTGVLAFVGVVAVLLGTLLVPHRAARLTTGVLLICVGVVLVPGVTRLTYDVVGLGPTLWRLTWACTVAALVGVLTATLWARAPSALVARLGAAAAAIVLVVTGAPIWAPDTSTSLEPPPHWQRGDSGRAMAAWVIAHAGPGGLVLAPQGLAITVAVTSTEVKTVAPRDYYLAYLRDEPDFHYDERLRLVDFVNAAADRREDIGSPLRLLGVDVACVYRGDVRGVALLRASGYRMRHTNPTYRCGEVLNGA